MDQLQLRRVYSESRFSLPEAPSASLTSPDMFDDELDLLEIDLNDPEGTSNHIFRAKMDSELIHSNAYRSSSNITRSIGSVPLISDALSSRQRPKQLRDQTTNTPPMSTLTSSIKAKKKLKKKSSSPISNTPDRLASPVATSPVLSTKLQKVCIFSAENIPSLTSVIVAEHQYRDNLSVSSFETTDQSITTRCLSCSRLSNHRWKFQSPLHGSHSANRTDRSLSSKLRSASQYRSRRSVLFFSLNDCDFTEYLAEENRIKTP